MVDIWRVKNPEVFAFTWKRDAPHLVLSRLNYILITTRTIGWVDDV